MKNIRIVLFLIIIAFALSSCTTSSSSNDHFALGYLKLYNHSNAPVTITWSADNSHDVIGANNSRIFEFSMRSSITNAKSVATSYTCEGLYIKSETLDDVIYVNQTTIRDLDPNLGCIDFINNTAGHIDISIPDLTNSITIGADNDYIQAWLLSGFTDVVDFSFSGDFVFQDSDQMTVNLNSTGSYTVNATGAAIKIRNVSPAFITEVYISPNSDTGWGTNDLNGSIAPGNFAIFTVAPNSWDVLVVDSDGISTMWQNNGFIDFNEMLTLSFDKKKSGGISTKRIGMGSPHVGPFKIQQNKQPIK